MSEIVVGIDDSAGAQDALAFAARVAEATGASSRLASAFLYSDVPSRASNEAYREYPARRRAGAAATARGGRRADVAGTEAIADPSPPHALHDLAERIGAALVVVGSTHRGPSAGSCRQHRRALLHGSPCPVAIVPRGLGRKGRSAPSASATTEAMSPGGAAPPRARWPAVRRRAPCHPRLRRGRVGAPALMTIPGYVGVREDYEAMTANASTRRSPRCRMSAEPVFVTGTVGHELAAQSELVDLMVVG